MDKAPVPIKGLFETHLTVSDLQRSIKFYREIIGLDLGLENSERQCAFFWIGRSKNSMLGLWSTQSIPIGLVLHVAFEVSLNDLLNTSRVLRSYGITPLSFFEQETDEPSVLCWIPAASIYFRDPDGHLIEYLALLNESPKPTPGVIPYSEWVTDRKNK
ncbi:VOC family protein [Candidatus Nitrosocosmicus franklandus]|uniref:Glyoxalase n=1 Tax=Candidatus Nitrosocosmicus franklandianus TaxID=1798806 RepID=A0A484ICF1_9ARCH|nr:VOC family protein [Candidatus Nitrosocosmicus franklandus]VFJ14780.1 Glyoxalase [Candidatus Nitrosocosmicus franklandus]